MSNVRLLFQALYDTLLHKNFVAWKFRCHFNFGFFGKNCFSQYFNFAVNAKIRISWHFNSRLRNIKRKNWSFHEKLAILYDTNKKKGRCFRCMRPNHISKNFPSNIKCFKCHGKDNLAVCEKNVVSKWKWIWNPWK